MESGEEPGPHKSFFWQLVSQWAVHQGDWKLLGNPWDNARKGPLGKDDKISLANLAKDLSEMKNLAKGFPETVQQMMALRDRYLAGLSDK